MKSLLTFFFLILPISYSSATETFSEQAWKKIEPIYKSITYHPFNQELMKGTLPKSKFSNYSDQDSLYLTEFARALSILATKLDNTEDTKRVLEFVRDCLKEEQKKPNRPIEMNPANFNYTNFLLRTASYGSREELAAALLPCFWIYYELARDFSSKVKRENPFYAWVALYSSERYRKDVEDMKNIVDRLAARVTKEERAAMMDAFQKASRMEWHFWDEAYHQRGWLPVI